MWWILAIVACGTGEGEETGTVAPPIVEPAEYQCSGGQIYVPDLGGYPLARQCGETDEVSGPRCYPAEWITHSGEVTIPCYDGWTVTVRWVD